MIGNELQVYFDDSFAGNITTSDSGIFSYDLFLERETELGPHKVKVVFEGSELYTESSKEISSDVQAATIFQVEDIEALRLHEFFISAYLVDDLNNGRYILLLISYFLTSVTGIFISPY